jgi:hypothetical protein
MSWLPVPPATIIQPEALTTDFIVVNTGVDVSNDLAPNYSINPNQRIVLYALVLSQPAGAGGNPIYTIGSWNSGPATSDLLNIIKLGDVGQNPQSPVKYPIAMRAGDKPAIAADIDTLITVTSWFLIQDPAS